MLDAVETESPDKILHLGDMSRDADDLAAAYPHIPVEAVSGNCDGWTSIPPERVLTLADRKILMGHGHTWRVKSGLETALHAARKSGADILLYGHTHIAACFQQDDLWVLNPGSIGDGRECPSYGIVTIENGSVTCKLLMPNRK